MDFLRFCIAMLNEVNSTTRGVIQLANKNDGAQFDQKDKQRMELL